MKTSRLMIICLTMSFAVFAHADTAIALTDPIEPETAGICDSFNITPIVQTHACHGPCLGVIELDISGGTPPYNYQWSTGSTEPVIGGLCDGEYSVTVSDGAKCFDNDAVTVDAPDTIIVSPAEILHASHGQSNGQVTLAVTGGTAPFRYTLEEAKTYQDSPTFPGLPAGMYAATVLDANSCTAVSDSFEIQNLLSTSELESKLTWYPNPASTHLYVDSDVVVSVAILNLHGHEVLQTEGSRSHEIPIGGIFPGLYLLGISDGTEVTYQKVIIR